MADIKYASLTYKDKDGNTGRLASLSENDIAKIKLAREHIAKIVNQTTGELIGATTVSYGTVELASDSDLTLGTEGKVVDAAQLAAVRKELSKVYKYKGSVATFEELPTEDVLNGDVYNVEQAHGDFPAGTNYAAIVDGDTLTWDALGGFLSTADFALKSGDNSFTGTNTVVDMSDDSADSQIANKKYVDDTKVALEEEFQYVVKFEAQEPDETTALGNQVVFYPGTDLL